MSLRLTLSLLASLIIAISGGFLVNIVFKLSGTDSFFSGLLLFILSELFLLLVDIDRLRTIRFALNSIAQTVKMDDRFSNYFLSLLISKIRKDFHLFSQKGIEIPKEDVAQIWTECIAHVDSELLVTSYVSPTAWWLKEYSDPNLELRKSKAKQKKSLRTLFIWDNPSEIGQLKEIAKEQHDAGIIVSHESLNNLKSDPVRSPKLKRIGTPDFGLIDGRWVFLHFLDKYRNTKNAILTNDQDIVDACRNLLSTTPGSSDFGNILEQD